jgi:glycerophosphoryl diester phosphodiesterase
MNILKPILFYNFVTLLFTTLTMAQQATFDWQGHRGARGLMPENSIPAFKKALDLGMTTLELDVVISQDKKVVVSHEPFFSADICLDAKGKEITKADEKKYNIYTYTYELIKSFDCGSKGNSRFPEQQKMKVHKPLLSDVFKEMEQYRKQKNLPRFNYNIEIKSAPEGDNTYHPAPAEFSDIVYNLIKQHVPLERITLQSFDFRVLQYWHQKYPEVKLAALVANTKSTDENIQNLGFTPHIYSPYYEMLLNQEEVKRIQSKGIQVIPWTVNDAATMKKLQSWGVDGIITDYPDRAKGL